MTTRLTARRTGASQVWQLHRADRVDAHTVESAHGPGTGILRERPASTGLSLKIIDEMRQELETVRGGSAEKGKGPATLLGD